MVERRVYILKVTFLAMNPAQGTKEDRRKLMPAQACCLMLHASQLNRVYGRAEGLHAEGQYMGLYLA